MISPGLVSSSIAEDEKISYNHLCMSTHSHTHKQKQVLECILVYIILKEGCSKI